MTPEDLLDPAELPDDLKWIPAHYRLNPSDPVYLLLAWHWRRVKQSEDALRAGIIELKAALDTRLGALQQGTETVAAVRDQLAALQESLDGKPAQLGSLIEAKVHQPIAQAVAQIEMLERSVSPLAAMFAASQRRQILAVFLVGVCAGLLAGAIVMLA
jgi:hypothetical protein